MSDLGRIDLPALKAALRAAAARSRALKAMLRVRWQEPMAEQQRALHKLRRRTTDLCVLRAWLRGRQHVANAPGDPGEYHREVSERVAAEFQLRVEEVA